MQNSEANSQRVSGRRSRTKKPSVMKIVIFVIIGIILVYIIAAIISGLAGGLKTTTALNGSVTEEFRCDGYIFKDASVINAPSSGHIECVVSEGERVKQGQTVAYVYSEQPSREIVAKIKNLYNLLRSENMVKDAKTYNVSSSSSRSTVAISESVRDMSDIAKKNDLSLITDAKEDLNDVLASHENNETGKSAEQIQAEIDELNREAGNGQIITSPVGGIFSGRVDGMEDMLAYGKAAEVTPAYIKELNSVKPNTSESVEAGKPICKIVNNYNWYFSALTDEKNTEGLSEGSTVELGFFDLTNATVKGTIKHISETDSGKRVITVATNKYVDGIYSQSKISADIVTVRSEGIKLPASAIHVKDSNTGIYVIRLDVARFVPVNIKYKNDKWAIVSPAEPTVTGGTKLQIYDEVIVDKKNLEDGKRVR